MARILVLEDELDFRNLLCEALRMFDHEAHPAASGPEAIAAATRSKFDLIVSDVRMAGMDGLDCLAALVPLCPSMKRIVITGYASDDAPARAIAVQAEDYLYKPFELDEFIEVVNRVLDASKEANLLAGMIGRYRKLVTRDPGPGWQEIDVRRHLAYQSLFLGIRSGKLSELEAGGLWDRLEALDGEREEARTEGLTRERGQALLEGFQYVIDLAGAVASSSLYVPPKRSEQGLKFATLFERVKRGKVALEQLKLAPFLRGLPFDVVASSPDLAQLHEEVWGPPV